MAIDPSNPVGALAGTWEHPSNLGKVYRTTGGSSWSNVATFNSAVKSIVFDPVNPLNVYASTWGYMGGPTTAIYKSTDGGITWNPTNFASSDSIVLAISGGPPTTIYAGTRAIGTPGDFNGNGHPDLIWQNQSTRQVTVNYYSMSGMTPSLTGWAWLNSSGIPGWRVVGTAEFDGNGVPDLVWMNDSTRQVTVNYYMFSGGIPLYNGWAWLNSSGIAGWSVVAVADVDGNGVPDLIWQNDTTHQVTVNYYTLNNGLPQYSGWAWLNSSGFTGWTVAGMADYDGNGVPDLVWMNTGTRQVTVNYYSNTNGAPLLTGWAWLNSGGIPGWHVAGVNDYDGNGVPDLVWENDATHQMTVNFYGLSAGLPLYLTWGWLNSSGIPGWDPVVPR